MVWGSSVADLDLPAGRIGLVHRLPYLPLRPGPYYWQVSVSNVHRSIDQWHCVPELVVATRPATHMPDRWTGVLNIGADFEVHEESGVAGPQADSQERN